VIISWAQRNPNAGLETFIGSPAQIDDFVRRLPGLVAALCAKEVTGPGKAQSVTKELKEAALARLKLIQSARPKDGYRGPSAEIVCADHLGRDAPYLLYQPDTHEGPSLRSRENFRDLAGWLLRGAIRGSYRHHVPSDAGEAIGAMLFEIFKNTEDHALTDSVGDMLDVSIRAIKTNHHSVAPDDLTRIVGDYAPLAAYCEALPVPPGAVQTHLFELSVLDSGPGFAATWTRSRLQDLSLEEEKVRFVPVLAGVAQKATAASVKACLMFCGCCANRKAFCV
jgi:hypothetical protein